MTWLRADVDAEARARRWPLGKALYYNSPPCKAVFGEPPRDEGSNPSAPEPPSLRDPERDIAVVQTSGLARDFGHGHPWPKGPLAPARRSQLAPNAASNKTTDHRQ